MRLYNNFIGIDIGKFSFVVALYGEKTTKEYANTLEGIKEFLNNYEEILATAFCVLETTGVMSVIYYWHCVPTNVLHIELILAKSKILFALMELKLKRIH